MSSTISDDKIAKNIDKNIDKIIDEFAKQYALEIINMPVLMTRKQITETSSTGGSKKKRTVIIKSEAMPKTVKGLETRKKLLKEKIKKTEKKVKLNKNRVIKLKGGELKTINEPHSNKNKIENDYIEKYPTHDLPSNSNVEFYINSHKKKSASIPDLNPIELEQSKKDKLINDLLMYEQNNEESLKKLTVMKLQEKKQKYMKNAEDETW